MVPMNGASQLDQRPVQSIAPRHSTLEITQQPPQKWYKDQFGRKATFDVRVRRVLQGCEGCAERRHLVVTLLYENGCVYFGDSSVNTNVSST